MAQPVSADLADYMQSGVSILVASRDARLFPASCRAMGVRVERGRRSLTVFVPVATGGELMEALAASGRLAICFARIEDHRAIQVKGAVLSSAPACEADRAVIDRYRCEWARNLAFIGLAPRIALRQNGWPAHAVRVRIDSLFAQTPGPGAGAPLDAPAGEGAP